MCHGKAQNAVLRSIKERISSIFIGLSICLTYFYNKIYSAIKKKKKSHHLFYISTKKNYVKTRPGSNEG
jgi:hypothetical protein